MCACVSPCIEGEFRSFEVGDQVRKRERRATLSLIQEQINMPPFATPEYCGKECQDFLLRKKRPTYFNGAIIVGAGPSGLATAASLKRQGVPSLIIEKSECIASLWKHKTYDRLHLHLPKQFCELPFFPFPSQYPTYPTGHQFVEYLERYTEHFGLKPLFNQSVDLAAIDQKTGLWRVHTSSSGKTAQCVREYRARWLVVATGENSEAVVPAFKGMKDYGGKVFHSSRYRNGAQYEGKKVLVVGCGNSGMEIALDLANFGGKPSLVVRSPAHILPREICGQSTFAVAMKLMKTFPCWFTDLLLVSYTYLLLGDTASYGISRPSEGPMALKNKYGKTPILDVGTFAKIRSGQVKVVPAIECLTSSGAQFEDGQVEEFEAVILATGYRSNVPKWLKDDKKFFSEEGLPRNPFPRGWKGESGLYVAGLGRKGLLGASFDAKHIADDISGIFFSEIPNLRVVPCQQR